MEEAQPHKPAAHPAAVERISARGSNVADHHRAGVRRRHAVYPVCAHPEEPRGPCGFRVPGEADQVGDGMAGVDVIIPQGAPLPPYDVYAPLLTSPAWSAHPWAGFPTRCLIFPPTQPWWKNGGESFRNYPEFKVGINWQGNPKYAGDFHRSVPLRFFESVARVPGVRLFSLQKNDGTEQLQQIAGKFDVTELGAGLTSRRGLSWTPRR